MAMVRPASAVVTPTGGSGAHTPDLEAGHHPHSTNTGGTSGHTTTGGTTTNGGHITPGGGSSLPGVYPLQQQSTSSSMKPQQNTLPSSRPISRAGFVEMAPVGGGAAAGGSQQQSNPSNYNGVMKQSQVHPALVARDPLAHAASNYSFTKWAIGLFIIFAIFVVMDCFQLAGRKTIDDGRDNTKNLIALSWVCQILGLFGVFFSFASLGLFQHPFTAYSMVLLFVSFFMLFASAALISSKTTQVFLDADNDLMAAFVLQWIGVGLFFFYLCFLFANCFNLIREAARHQAAELARAQAASVAAAERAAANSHIAGVKEQQGLGLGRSPTGVSAPLSEELVAAIKQKDRDIEQRTIEVRKLQEAAVQHEEAATKRQVELADHRDKADRLEDQLRREKEEKNKLLDEKQKAILETARLQELVGSSQDQIAREAQRLGNEVARLAEEAKRNGDEAKEYKALCSRLEAEKTALAKQMATRKKEGEMLASKAEEILSTVDDQENVIAKSKETVAALREENKKLRETLATQKVVLEAEKGELQKKLRTHQDCENEKKNMMAQIEALRDSTARTIDPNQDTSKLLAQHPLFKNLNKLGAAASPTHNGEEKEAKVDGRPGQLPPMDLSAQLQATQQLLASVVKEHAQCDPLRQRCAELEKDLATCEKHWSAAQKELARTKTELGARISELENDVVVYEEQLGALRGDSEIRADLVREAQARFSGLRPQLGCEFMPGPKNGVRLTSVMPGKSADIAGLAVNDIVEQVNGRETRTKEQFKAAVSSILPGDAVPFQIERGRDILTVVVHVGTQGMTQQQINDLRRMASGMVKDSDIRAAKAAKEQASLPPSTA